MDFKNLVVDVTLFEKKAVLEMHQKIDKDSGDVVKSFLQQE